MWRVRSEQKSNVTICEQSPQGLPTRHDTGYYCVIGAEGFRASTTLLAPHIMAHTLIRDGLTATFKVNGIYVEITRQTRQEVKIRVEECLNEWYGLPGRPTGEIATQIVTGENWTEVTRPKARQIWSELISQGWQPA